MSTTPMAPVLGSGDSGPVTPSAPVRPEYATGLTTATSAPLSGPASRSPQWRALQRRIGTASRATSGTPASDRRRARSLM